MVADAPEDVPLAFVVLEAPDLVVVDSVVGAPVVVVAEAGVDVLPEVGLAAPLKH